MKSKNNQDGSTSPVEEDNHIDRRTLTGAK